MPAPQPYDVVAVNLEPDSDNPIHADDVARQFGFSGALVPGVEVFALATVPFVRAWGVEWLAGGRLAIRFRRPVYDGDRVQVVPAPADDGSVGVEVLGPDGALRARGVGHPPGPAPAVRDLPEAPLPARLVDAPQPGPFGTVTEPADPATCASYVERIGDPLAVYRDAGLVHPGLLLRLVNAALMRNVALGPWVHTASDCRLLSPARVDEPLSVRSEVTELFTRKGSDYVRYDALVLAGDRPVAAVDHEAIWRLAPAPTADAGPRPAAEGSQT